MHSFRSLFFLVVLELFLNGCTATSMSPALSAQPRPPLRNGTVWLTSGSFKEKHQIIGVIQMLQTGYKWMHEVEIITDSNPASILYQVAAYAHSQGADGVQHLVIIDENPQTPGEKGAQQVATMIRLIDQVRSNRVPTAAGEGTKTRYHVKGELVKFTEGENR